MATHRGVTRKDWRRTALYVFLTILFIAASGYTLISRFWAAGFIIWLLICVGGSLFLLVSWHARGAAYKCRECGTVFEITPLTDFLSPPVLTRKYLKCPSCGSRNWKSTLVNKQ